MFGLDTLKNLFKGVKDKLSNIKLPKLNLPNVEIRFPDLSKYKLSKGKQNVDWDFEGNPIVREEGEERKKDDGHYMGPR